MLIAGRFEADFIHFLRGKVDGERLDDFHLRRATRKNCRFHFEEAIGVDGELDFDLFLAFGLRRNITNRIVAEHVVVAGSLLHALPDDEPQRRHVVPCRRVSFSAIQWDVLASKELHFHAIAWNFDTH